MPSGRTDGWRVPRRPIALAVVTAVVALTGVVGTTAGAHLAHVQVVADADVSPTDAAVVERAVADVAAGVEDGWGGRLPPGTRVEVVVDQPSPGQAAWTQGGVVRVAAPAVESLAPTGLRMLLAHELVHVAARSDRSDLPLWWEEGYADAVALDVTGVPLDTVVAEVAGDPGPPRLPADDALRAGDPAAYALATATVALLARQHGLSGLTAAYRQSVRAAADGARPDVAVAAALRQQLGTTPAAAAGAAHGYLAGLPAAPAGGLSA